MEQLVACGGQGQVAERVREAAAVLWKWSVCVCVCDGGWLSCLWRVCVCVWRRRRTGPYPAS